MSKMERMVRIILAFAIFAIGIYYGSWWALVGIIPLFSGIFKVCPISFCMGKKDCFLKKCSTSQKKDE